LSVYIAFCALAAGCRPSRSSRGGRSKCWSWLTA